MLCHPKAKNQVTAAKLPAIPQRQPSSMVKNKAKRGKRANSGEKLNMGSSGQYGLALGALADSIGSTKSSFVICLRPNDRRLPDVFDVSNVRTQVQYFGLKHIAQKVQYVDHAVCIPLIDFCNKYAGVGQNELPGTDTLSKVLGFRDILNIHDKDMMVGSSNVFLSESAWNTFEDTLRDPGLLKSFPPSRDSNTAGQHFYSLDSVAISPDEPTRGRQNSRYLESRDFGKDPGNAISRSPEPNGSWYDNDGDRLRSSQSTLPHPPNLEYSGAKSYTPSIATGDMFRDFDSRSVMQSMDNLEKGSTQVVTDEIITTSARKRWMTLVWFLTWYIPDVFLKWFGHMRRKDVQIAWREKLAINILIWLLCGVAIFVIIPFPTLLCPKSNVLLPSEVQQKSLKSSPNYVLTSIRGKVFDLTKFQPSHYPSFITAREILNYGGADSSLLFPVQISALCDGISGQIDPAVFFTSPAVDSDVNINYHDFRYFTNDYRPDWYFYQMKNLKKQYQVADVGFTPTMIQGFRNSKRSAALLNGKVYDLTDYISGSVGRKLPSSTNSNASAPANMDGVQFLDKGVEELFRTQAGSDVTEAFEQLNLDTDLKSRMQVCLDNLFYVGVLDPRTSARCLFASYFMLSISVFLGVVILIKFLASLQFAKKSKPEDSDKFLICFVPCYTEGEVSLSSTFQSLARMKYDDTRKLLFIVCK